MMDAIVLAGGIPQPGQPLYAFAKGRPKAMLNIAGKPMVQWILNALSKAKSIDNVVIVGLSEDTGIRCEKKLYFIPNQAGMIENMQTGARIVKDINPGAGYVLLVSTDIPTITGEMVDWIINAVNGQNLDIFYNIISQATMEKRFPCARRTYLHFKDMVFCSGDLHAVSLRILLEENVDVWRRITDARKSPLKQAALIGFDTIILYLFRQLTLKLAEAKVIKRLKVTGKVQICPYAEIGMDVDKPQHLEIVTKELQKQLELSPKV